MLSRWRYQGQHRGEYKPSPHWRHRKCYPNGMCLYGIRAVKITPYIPPGMPKPENVRLVLF